MVIVSSASAAVDVRPLEPDAIATKYRNSHKTYLRHLQAIPLATTTPEWHKIRDNAIVTQSKKPDHHGRATFVFHPARIQPDTDLDLLTTYAVALLHEHVALHDKPYTVVWISDQLGQGRLNFFWFRRIYKMVPPEFHHNMRSLAIVHPTLTVRFTLFCLSYLLQRSFWDKLYYADRVEFLDELMDVDALELPSEVLEFDRFLDHDMELRARQIQEAGVGSLGGSMLPGMDLGAPGADPFSTDNASRFVEFQHSERLKAAGTSSADDAAPARHA